MALWQMKHSLLLFGRKRNKALPVVAAAFRTTVGSTKTCAACLIISEKVPGLIDEATEYLEQLLGEDTIIDRVCGLLVLEALQFLPDIRKHNVGAKRLIAEYADGETNGKDLAEILQNMDIPLDT